MYMRSDSIFQLNLNHMKTNKFLTLLFLFVIGLFHCQTTYEKIKNSETSNNKEVFTDIMQFAFNNITSEDKELSFKANFFQLKAIADPSLLIDENLKKYYFLRNFQFDLGVKLEDDKRINGFTAGFTYNVINSRDIALFTINKKLDAEYLKYFDSFTDKLEIYSNKCFADNTNTQQKTECIEKGNKILTAFKNLKKGNDDYPEDFKGTLGEDFNKARKSLDSAFAVEKEEYFAKPILTLSANGDFGKQKKFLNGGDLNLVYLQGIFKKKSRNEIDLRAGFSVKDTITTNQYFKKEFRTSAGINFSLLKVENQKSWLEFKPYAEYIRNFEDGPFENMETFNANADLRFRIFKDIWIPLTIKYDLKEGKFLGFLNIVFDWGYFSPKRE